MFKLIIIIFSCILVTHSFLFDNLTLSLISKNRETIKKLLTVDDFDYANVTVKVDHFNPLDTRTFELPYIINEDYFKPNGPIFLCISRYEYDQYGHMFEMGRELGAYMIAPFLRFELFTPNGEGNMTMENLQYNTFEQKIEDLAVLIKTLKSEDRFRESKVVVFGCGEFAGNIATWIRLDHADIVDGAVASSAPVNVKAGMPEYFEHMSNEFINEEGQDCREIINAGFREIQQIVARNDSKQFEKIFNLCGPQSFQFEDVTLFIELNNLENFIIPSYNVCPVLRTLPGNPIEKISQYFKLMQSDCVSPIDFNEHIKFLKENEMAAPLLPWMYSICKQLGLFYVSDSPDMLFADYYPLSFTTEHFCPSLFDSSLYGENMIKSIQRVNQKYGGLSPNVTKVLSVHGSRDFKNLLGITKDLNSESPAIVIEDEFECADMMASLPVDRPQLKAARQRIRELVMRWIQ